MTASTTIQIRKDGTLTLPVDLCRKYGLDEGDIISLIDQGGSFFLLYPQTSQVDRLAGRVEQVLADEEVSLEDLLTTLDEERERFFQERYVDPKVVFLARRTWARNSV